MTRNKLPYIFLVFIFALVFVIGLMGAKLDWKYTPFLYWGGQIGLGISIILFLLVPAQKDDKINTKDSD